MRNWLDTAQSSFSPKSSYKLLVHCPAPGAEHPVLHLRGPRPETLFVFPCEMQEQGSHTHGGWESESRNTHGKEIHQSLTRDPEQVFGSPVQHLCPMLQCQDSMPSSSSRLRLPADSRPWEGAAMAQVVECLPRVGDCSEVPAPTLGLTQIFGK